MRFVETKARMKLEIRESWAYKLIHHHTFLVRTGFPFSIVWLQQKWPQSMLSWFTSLQFKISVKLSLNINLIPNCQLSILIGMFWAKCSSLTPTTVAWRWDEVILAGICQSNHIG